MGILWGHPQAEVSRPPEPRPERVITDRYHVLWTLGKVRRTPRVFTAKAALTPRVPVKNLQSGRTHERRFANEHVTSPNEGLGANWPHPEAWRPNGPDARLVRILAELNGIREGSR